MANELTSDALDKVAARFAELFEWVKQPANQTFDAVATDEADVVPNEEEPRSSMYPELHEHVAKNLEEDGLQYTFRQNDQKVGIKRVYDTKVIGGFTYRKRKCGLHYWFSNSIAIRIREYEGHQYNVRVYHQRCSQCEQPTRAKLKKFAYADRVAYHLKRWNGIDAEPPKIDVDRKSNHRQELCEGCKKGRCGDKRDKKKKTVLTESENASVY
ncbi:hypothetical protein FMUND_13520 [Fusarium mundagurra]|uniref:3CxxC-type domain-containing protein n=1 Tax=Fusarium mundagurra TaxID=1567541 RepID=A0A8H6D3T1_9HYPO|nr:hypothetical protein FMUND_13520 [Fusarium mundagurra]